jgi:catechol 2,3-dioxygenase-like lactoylglutathione lyase family enzyme
MGDIPVLGIHEIAFEVRDLERSIAFYRDILGLPLYSRGPQQAWFCIGTQDQVLSLFHVRCTMGENF